MHTYRQSQTERWKERKKNNNLSDLGSAGLAGWQLAVCFPCAHNANRLEGAHGPFQGGGGKGREMGKQLPF